MTGAIAGRPGRRRTRRRARTVGAFAGIAALAAICGCGPSQGVSPRFDGPKVLGGTEVSASELERGREVYQKLCRSCHGERGGGDGPAARHLEVQPRDLRTANYRYKSTPGDELPTHGDLVKIIRGGKSERGMPAWSGMPPEDLDAVAHYIKTFSPRWLRTTASAADAAARSSPE